MDVATRSKIRKPFIMLITPLAAASQEAFNNLHYGCTSSGLCVGGERRFVNYTWPRWVESAPQERLCIGRPQAWTHDPLGGWRNVAPFPGCFTWLHPDRLGLPQSNLEVKNHLAMKRGKGRHIIAGDLCSTHGWQGEHNTRRAHFCGFPGLCETLEKGWGAY